MRRPVPDIPRGFGRDNSRRSVKLMSGASVLLALVVSAAVSNALVTRFGAEVFVFALIGLFVGTLYTVISFKNLLVPFLIWVLTIGGFRFLFVLHTPLLPDLYLDRLLMIWLLGVFMMKFFAERRSFVGPYVLDLFLLAHALYLFTSVFLNDMAFLNPWTQSILIPYGAYFFAKNTAVNEKSIRMVLLALLALVVYYTITAIAEKFNINWAIWPKSIINLESPFKGRSIGPFRQAPLFGTIIGMLLPVYLYFLVTTRRRILKILLFVGLGLGFGGVYFTYTRGSWLAAITALLTVAALSPKHYLRVLAPVAFVVPIVAVAFLGLNQDEFMKKRLENEDTVGSRFGTAVTALRIFRDHPITGVGFFKYREARVNYIEPVDIPGMATISFAHFRHNNIHDIYLGPLAENGIIGAFLQGGIYFLVFRTFLRKFRGHDREGSKADPVVTYAFPVFVGLFVGYLVGGIAFDYRFFAFTDTLFYMCAGILYGYKSPENDYVS